MLEGHLGIFEGHGQAAEEGEEGEGAQVEEPIDTVMPGVGGGGEKEWPSRRKGYTVME